MDKATFQKEVATSPHMLIESKKGENVRLTTSAAAKKKASLAGVPKYVVKNCFKRNEFVTLRTGLMKIPVGVSAKWLYLRHNTGSKNPGGIQY